MSPTNLTRNNIVLLHCLLAMIILSPLFNNQANLLQSILLTAILYSGIFSLDFSPRPQKILFALGTLTAIALWIHHFFPITTFALIDFISMVLFLIAIVVFLIRHIAMSQNVTATIILNSINGYLLLGVLGGLLLIITDLLHRFSPMSGQHAIDFVGHAEPQLHDYIYFSFVTLTTLGFGDITPLSYLARSVSILLAITGQLYMTILVAMLVGKFLARSTGK